MKTIDCASLFFAALAMAITQLPAPKASEASPPACRNGRCPLVLPAAAHAKPKIIDFPEVDNLPVPAAPKPTQVAPSPATSANPPFARGVYFVEGVVYEKHADGKLHWPTYSVLVGNSLAVRSSGQSTKPSTGPSVSATSSSSVSPSSPPKYSTPRSSKPSVMLPAFGGGCRNGRCPRR